MATSAAPARRRGWISAAVVAAVLGFGAVLFVAVRDQLQVSLGYQLRGNLAARVRLLREWRERQLQAARQAAADPELIRMVRQLAAGPQDGEREALWRRLQATLAAVNVGNDELRAPLQGVAAALPDGTILAASDARLVGRSLAALGDGFADRLVRDGGVVTHPALEPGGSGRAFLLSAAAILDGNQLVGVLGFRIDPVADFSRILDGAHETEAARTFAFDRDGVLLSNAFDAHTLREVGLLPRTDEQATPMLSVALRDPGVALHAGARTQRPSSQWPLVRSVEAAVESGAGLSVEPYRDVLGRKVIGAWDWLDELELGVALEVDYRVAYRPLDVMLWWYGAVLVLLVCATVAGLLFANRGAHLRLRLRRANRDLRELGQYRLETRLGSGGMGQVYLARHTMMRRPVAIKLLQPDRSEWIDEQRFEREVQLTSMLSHPNTIQIYDYGKTVDGRFYYVMEFLDGVALEHLVNASGALPAARVIHVLRQICGSLAEAHARGLIHRDIKPANLMLCERGGVPDRVKVLDFGLVRDLEHREGETLTERNMVAGTPQYLSPEALLHADRIDARSDLYALGAVGWFLLTGQDLVQKDNAVGWVDQILHVPSRPPSKVMASPPPEDLEQVIMACLEKEPDKRPQSADELLARLDACRDAGKWTLEDARLAASKALPADAASTERGAPADSVQIDLQGPRGGLNARREP